VHRASLWAIVLLSGLVVQTAAQQAVLMNRATLRVDPSSKNPPMLRLDAGTDVDLIDPSRSHSYYHVRTADGQEGWIYSQTLKLVSAIPPPTTPPTPTSPGTPLLAPAGVSTLFSPDWEKPAPNQTTFTGPDGECGPTGDGGDTSTNARKNRTRRSCELPRGNLEGAAVVNLPSSRTQVAGTVDPPPDKSHSTLRGRPRFNGWVYRNDQG
jgi:hypothetical protein